MSKPTARSELPFGIIHNVVPGFAALHDQLSAIGTSGYVIALNSHYLTPAVFHATYPEEWMNKYASGTFAISDPVLIWATMNEGVTRWSEIGSGYFTKKLAQHIMKRATDYDINFGAVAVARNPASQNRKCMISVARPEREITAEELAQTDTILQTVLGELQLTGGLTAEDIRLLQLLANGATQDEIADVMQCSRDVVKKRLDRVRGMLGAKNTPNAVAIAVGRGYIKI